jgi:hypothetical protein
MREKKFSIDLGAEGAFSATFSFGAFHFAFFRFFRSEMIEQTFLRIPTQSELFLNLTLENANFNAKSPEKRVFDQGNFIFYLENWLKIYL